MDTVPANFHDARKTRAFYAVLLCAVGLLINIAGVWIARKTGVPLYIDNIGSALAAALGGTIPGIIVGFLTNLVNAIGDYTTAYYGSLTVLIAICSTWFEKNGYYTFKKPWRLLVVILVFSLIGGGLGSILTWTLYGFSFGEGISAPLAHRIYDAGRLSRFWSQFFADMLIDLMDKSVTVLIVAAVLNLLPPALRRNLYFTGWQQAPLSDEKLAEADKKQFRLVSLRSKITLLVAAAMIVIAAVITAISFSQNRSGLIEKQISQARGVARIAAAVIDPDRVDEYLEKGEDAEGYALIRERFRDLAESSENIEYVYAYQLREDGCHVVFDGELPEEGGWLPGEVVEYDQAFLDRLPSLLAGEEIEPVISNDSYGWLLTVLEPLHDSSGNCQCYIGVDACMSSIASSGYQFLARVISLFLGFFLLILALTLWLARFHIILPINTMALAAGSSSYETEQARKAAVANMRGLDIRTGDEIEHLYQSVTKTTEDMVTVIEHVEHQKQIIRKLQNGLIIVLADMVESRDTCTGQHVRKTAAYTDIIMHELKREGVYVDQLTDEFMSDVVSSAPLHDIGKIKVSDLILNKTGRLTDEEFSVMKSHTTAGSEVIEHAMRMVSEENSPYLREADNLALYHHEKWDGSGYPTGLKGEEIPLSARIMAVADVFDALVSKRSYKDGLSYEDAMAIIQSGAGTHFDPLIVNAFVQAGDEVRKAMEANMDI